MQITKTMFGNKPMKSVKEYNADVLREINVRKIDIDKSTFVKSDEDKDLLSRRKKAHNKMIREGSNTSERNEILSQIAGSKTPRFGSLKVSTF